MEGLLRYQQGLPRLVWGVVALFEDILRAFVWFYKRFVLYSIVKVKRDIKKVHDLAVSFYDHLLSICLENLPMFLFSDLSLSSVACSPPIRPWT